MRLSIKDETYLWAHGLVEGSNYTVKNVIKIHNIFVINFNNMRDFITGVVKSNNHVMKIHTSCEN